MKMRSLGLVLAGAIAAAGLAGDTPAQGGKAPAAAGGKKIIFAVINDGQTLEPIAYVENGKLSEPVNGSGEPAELSAFAKKWLTKGTVYDLIFGGAKGGTISVKSSNPKQDCGKNTAVAIAKPAKTKLGGYVMALATNAPIKAAEPFRRRPTAAEKAEADDLAKAEFAKHKLAPKVLRYHNLTALDLDGDSVAELVGSYWVEIDKSTRGLLFMIASKGTASKYSVGFQEYRTIDQSKVMSGEIKAVDEGIYHEVLLDVFDFDGDGVGNIFTFSSSFEGAGFNAYSKSGGKWVRSYEFNNYHCAY